MRAVLVVVLVAILIHLPNFPADTAPQEDAGVFLYAGQRILDGGLPYRDVWDHKPPLIYLVDALGLLLGRGSIVGVWALQALGYAIAAVVGYRTFTRAYGPRAALFGTLAWLLAAPRLLLYEGYFANFIQIFAAPLQFIALALFLDEDARQRRSWRSIAIGATAAIALLLTPTILGLWGGLGLFVVGGRLRRGSIRGALDRGASMGAGAAIPVLMAGIALTSAGILGDAWDQAVRYNATYTGTVSWSDRATSLRFGLGLLGSGGILIVALAGAGWALLALRDRTLLPRASPARRLTCLALLALPLDMVLGSSSGREHGYYWLAALPALGALAAFGAFAFQERAVRQVARRLRRPPAAVVAGAFALTLAVLALDPIPLMGRAAAATEDGLTRSAVDYVRQHTAPDDTLLVWGSRTAVNVVADRRSPTRYVYQYAPFSTRGYDPQPHVAEFARVLAARPPTMILDASRDSALTPSLEVAAAGVFDTQDPLYVFSPAVAEIARSILQRYERVGTVEPSGWPVYRLRTR